MHNYQRAKSGTLTSQCAISRMFISLVSAVNTRVSSPQVKILTQKGQAKESTRHTGSKVTGTRDVPRNKSDSSCAATCRLHACTPAQRAARRLWISTRVRTRAEQEITGEHTRGTKLADGLDAHESPIHSGDMFRNKSSTSAEPSAVTPSGKVSRYR